MAQPAAQRLGVPNPNATVTVTNGVPSPQNVTIPSKGIVQFSADGQDYLIELWDKKNEKHPAVCVYLSANSSIYLAGDPDSDDQNANCPYNIKTLSGAGGGLAAGGGNKIIIGSGPEDGN